MRELSRANAKPGPCAKCDGSGRYRWGARFTGRCNACRGRGHQTLADIARNTAYNRHQLRSMTR